MFFDLLAHEFSGHRMKNGTSDLPVALCLVGSECRRRCLISPISPFLHCLVPPRRSAPSLRRSPGKRGDLAALPLPVSVRLPALTNRLLTRRLPLLEMEVVEAEPEAEGALRRRFAIVGLFSFHFFFRCCRSHRCGCGFGWIFAFCLFFCFVEAEFEVEAEGLVVVNSAFIGEFSL